MFLDIPNYAWMIITVQLVILIRLRVMEKGSEHRYKRIMKMLGHEFLDDE